MSEPYLILISLDGFRWDYVDRFKPPHLSQFIKNGVKAQSLIPSFPSKTFPNHYTIATGMYPDKNGILGNSFYDYKTGLTYSINNRERVEDGGFYAGIPIWVQAAKAGMVTASYFFVGTEAKIGGIRPNYYYNYEEVANQLRVTQALDWLSLPAKQRPHLITLYFSDMDDVGHAVGPNNDAVLKTTLFKLDEVLGDLFKGVKDSKLPVNIVIVSDHGMTEVPVAHYIPFESIKNDELYLAVNNGALINIHPKDKSQTQSVFNSLQEKAKSQHYKVYKTENTPGFEYTPHNKNWGSIQVVADNGYYFLKEDKIKIKQESGNTVYGAHGYDARNKETGKEMHGIFYANGPAFKKGLTVPSFTNIHIYPIMCKILGLDIPDDIDGKLEVLDGILK
ncbi:MAG: ectonucleotide pyrophosphatase/phosphodiesterase [Proteobacteria bacterium]|nr:ectonucleotide pyrophosphatase/phosphodiesterase [Pseudomonadota bacterium]